MRFSDDRISHLTHLIYDRLWKADLVDYPNENMALQTMKDALFAFFHLEDDIDTHVTEKIQTQKRGIVPGSAEWDVLYQKYFAEEWRKLGH